jgi:hypothetical protein
VECTALSFFLFCAAQLFLDHSRIVGGLIVGE